MFNNPTPIDKSREEGYVTAVDPIRGMCKVKTLRGQNLGAVTVAQPFGGSGRAGDRIMPRVGDKVLIDFGLGYPLITASLPVVQSTLNAFPLAIDTGSPLIDTGNFSSEGVNAVADQSKPRDILAGDRVMASEGGGMVSMLRGGSVLLRSSRLSEILLSKFGDLVRIVSRNFEHFTDASTDVIRNVKGAVYRYHGVASSFAKAKIEDYSFHRFFGHTAAAESLLTRKEGTIPPDNGVIYKEAVKEFGVDQKMSRTVSLDGTDETIVVNTRSTQSAEFIVMTHGGERTVTINGDMIQIDFGGSSKGTFTGDEIVLEHGSGSVTLNGGGVYNQHSGHYINITSGGVSMG